MRERLRRATARMTVPMTGGAASGKARSKTEPAEPWNEEMLSLDPSPFDTVSQDRIHRMRHGVVLAQLKLFDRGPNDAVIK